jgi:hypothetical protein
MAKRSPFLQRRGDAFGFRIVVPADIRAHVGRREITRLLGTSDKVRALPHALMLAATAKQLFAGIREAMTANDKDRVKWLVETARKTARMQEQQDESFDALADQRSRHLADLRAVKAQHAADMETAKLQATVDALRQGVGTAPARVPPNVPMFAEVIKGFFNQYQAKKMPAMYSKHESVLPLLLEVIGNRLVTEILQTDLNDIDGPLARPIVIGRGKSLLTGAAL